MNKLEIGQRVVIKYYSLDPGEKGTIKRRKACSILSEEEYGGTSFFYEVTLDKGENRVAPHYRLTKLRLKPKLFKCGDRIKIKGTQHKGTIGIRFPDGRALIFMDNIAVSFRYNNDEMQHILIKLKPKKILSKDASIINNFKLQVQTAKATAHLLSEQIEILKKDRQGLINDLLACIARKDELEEAFIQMKTLFDGQLNILKVNDA